MDGALLQTQRLSHRYGDVTVLRDITMDVRSGEIHALLGANGAGKSTLCKIISGLVVSPQTTKTPSAILLDGRPFHPRSKQHAEAAGVQIVQQELNLIGTLSVAENLFLAKLPNVGGVLRHARLHEESRRILDRFGLNDVSTEALVESLGVGRQQMVEIATALARQCRLLILDEPTAALSANESEKLFAHLRSLREEGVGILYISHRLDEVAALSDRVTVLRDGQFVATRQTDSMTTDDMIDLMSGESQFNVATAFTSHRRPEVAISVRSLCCGMVNDVSLDVGCGERLGITGLVGSGRTELLRAIFGADVASSGAVSIVGRTNGRRFRSPSEAVAAGLAMVTEDRKQNGLLLSQSITTNTTLASLRNRFSRFGIVRDAYQRRVSQQWVDELETRCQSIDQLASTLSGGNQQKIAVSKWLVRDADIFLFDEPTRGIDVAARRRIYRLMETLAADGKSLIIVSSDLEELMETCDAIAVMCNGRLTQTFQRDQWSHEKLMQASFSGFVQ